MTFTEFVEFSNYSATHVANCIMYKPESRPAMLAKKVGFNPTREELTKMRYLLSGKKKIEHLFPAKAV